MAEVIRLIGVIIVTIMTAAFFRVIYDIARDGVSTRRRRSGILMYVRDGKLHYRSTKQANG